MQKKHKKAALFMLMLLVLSTTASTFHFVKVNAKEIVIKDGNNVTSFTTFNSTVQEVIDNQGVVLSEHDMVIPTLDAKLKKFNEIVIHRAVPVSITADGQHHSIMTTGNTVAEVLSEAGILIGDDDILNCQPNDGINAGMDISIIRVTKEQVIEAEPIPYETKKQANAAMKKDSTNIKVEGQEGILEKKFLRVLHDNNEVSKDLIEKTVLKEPVDKIIEYGTMEPVAVVKTPPVSKENLKYSKVLKMSATAYDLSYESCGKNPGDKGYGLTSTGMRARYGVVAVDPKVIPLHSKLYIEGENGNWVYGEAVAGDIGGAVKGNIIDLFFDSPSEVKRFGRRTANVYVLE